VAVLSLPLFWLVNDTFFGILDANPPPPNNPEKKEVTVKVPADVKTAYNDAWQKEFTGPTDNITVVVEAL
jgi:hypothetical protein